MRQRLLSLTIGFCCITTFLYAQNTSNVLGGGININEILPDPNSAGNNFDTDGSGAANTTDEFVELHNLSGTPIDIGGWELWDGSSGNIWFTFPLNTVVEPGRYASVIVGVQSGGSIPMVGEGNYVFDAGSGSGILNNTGDNIVLYNPNADNYIQLLYNGDTQDDPLTFGGFSGTASIVGTVENWGNDADGETLTREPSGDINVVRHTTTPANLLASPSAPSCGLSVQTNKADVLCNGFNNGNAEVIVFGGSFPYSYNWSTGETTSQIFGLNGGVYDYTVTDLFCSEMGSVEVNEPDPLNVTVTTVTETCLGFDGAMSVTNTTGGTTPYSYNWTDQFGGPMGGGVEVTNIESDNYVLQVNDANSCVIAQGVFIPLEELNISITTSPSTCGASDGSVTAIVTGGETPYSYYWDSGHTTSQFSGVPSGLYIVTVTDNQGCQDQTGNAVQDAGAPSLNVTKTNVVCAGEMNGTNTVVASGGQTPYSYQWEDLISGMDYGTTQTITGLGEGFYIVTVTDGLGCKSISADDDVVDPDPISGLSSNITAFNVTTNGGSNGSAFISDWNIFGGHTPYTYLWSEGSTTTNIGSLTAGVYTVTLTDAGGCQDYSSVTVTEPPPCVMTVTTNHQDDYCNDGQGWAQAVQSGGYPPFNYNWDNGGSTVTNTDLWGGVYSVTVTDTWGCQNNASVTVTSLPSLNINITTTDATVCGASDGTAVTAVSGGTSPYDYMWSTGATTSSVTGLMAQIVGITVSDANGCMDDNGQSIDDPGSPSSSRMITSVTCAGAADGIFSLSVTGGTTPYTYNWSDAIGNPIGGNTATITGLSGGLYLFTITDGAVPGCVSTGADFVNENDSVRPNADAQDIFAGTSNTGEAWSNPYGGDGGPYSYLWNTAETDWRISGLGAGTFTVTATDASGCFGVESVTVIDPCDGFMASISTINDTCGLGEGYANANAVGGVAPYNYNWSSGAWQEDIDNLNSGSSYNVTVYDIQGCQTVSAWVTITGPANELDLSMTFNDVTICGGTDGSASIAVTGGTTPYDYLWNSGETVSSISGLSAGAALITITDANGCSEWSGAPINDPGAPSITITTYNATCWDDSDGSATVDISGGTSPYTFYWENGAGMPMGTTQTITGLPEDVYIVTVTDSNVPGCSSVDGDGLQANPEIEINIGFTWDPSCAGASDGQAQVNVTNGAFPMSYLWDNGDTWDNSWNLHGGANFITITDRDGCSSDFVVTLTDPVAITVTTMTTDADCGVPNGTATATAIGAGPGYNYLWSNGDGNQMATNLFAGNYGVTATNWNGCVGTAQATVNNPNSPMITVTTDNVPSCNGDTDGQASVAVSGGTTPYSYAWDNGQTNMATTGLGNGILGITVTDGANCDAAGTTNIIEPAVVAVNVTVMNPTTIGGTNGTATAMVTGGTTPYSYTWMNSGTTMMIAGLSAGGVGVSVSDVNGCMDNSGNTLMDPPCNLSITTNGFATDCNGSSNGDVMVIASGGFTPYSYNWSNGSTTAATGNILPAGSYGVTVTDAVGCVRNGSATVTEPSLLNISLTSNSTTCNGASDGSITSVVTGGVSPYSYMWSNSNTNQGVLGLVAGTYGLTVTDGNACVASSSIAVSEPVALSITEAIMNASCNGSSNGTAMVTPMGGPSTAYTYSWSNGGNTSSITGLSANTYGVTVSSNTCTISRMITISEPALLSVSLTPSDASCNGTSDGSITSMVSGGVTPYSYMWSNSATTQNAMGLNASGYGVTVTDNNSCVAMNSATVSEPMVLTFTETVVNADCNGGSNGSITVTPSGGPLTTYNYAWTNGGNIATASGLSANVYGVTVSSGICTAMKMITVTEPAPINVSLTANGTTCNGASDGSINSSITGGTSPYLYAWSNTSTTQNISGLSANSYTLTITDNNSCVASNSVMVSEPAMMSFTETVINASCNGNSDGSITIVPMGGPSTAYTYAWSNGGNTAMINGLSANTYGVTVTSGVCSNSGVVTVSEPALLSVSVTANDASCNSICDGSAMAAVTGGTMPYVYSWSDGSSTQTAVSLCANTYDVTVTDANGCSIAGSTTIAEPTAITVTSIETNVSCFGGADGSVTINATGGTTPFNYMWSNGETTSSVSGLSANIYGLTLTDGGACEDISSYTITEPGAISVAVVSVTDAACGIADGQITVAASNGATPYTYAWSNGQGLATATGLAAGSYDVTVTDNGGCSVMSSTGISNTGAPSITVTSVANTLCNGSSEGELMVAGSGGTTPYTYLWDDVNSQTSSTATGLTANGYSVVLTDAVGCVAVGLGTVTEPGVISISGTVLDASCNGSSDGSAAANAMGGTSGYSYLWSNGSTTATISGIPAGNYDVTVTDANGCAMTSSETVNEPATISLTSASTDASCDGLNDGVATVSATGGTAPYTYSWDDGQNTAMATGLLAGLHDVTVTDDNGCMATTSASLSAPGAIVASTTISEAACGSSDGSATVMVTGGTGPYNYLWDNSGMAMTTTGLSGGSYSVTITDANGCEQIATAIITNVGGASVTVTSTDILCNGDANGSAVATVQGGTTPYSYSWDDVMMQNTATATGLDGGSYSVIVTDGSGCISSESALVAEPTTITLTSIVSDQTCSGACDGAVSTMVAGGTTGYTYTWSNSNTTMTISGLCGGSYDVTVMDANGCEESASITITNPSQITVSVSSTQATCASSDGSVTASAQGGNSGYSFNWSDGSNTNIVSGLTSGNYSVTVMDMNGCSETGSTTVTATNGSVVAIAISTNVSCNGGNDGVATVTGSGGATPYSYEWDNGEVTAGINGVTTGTYSVTVSDANGCEGSSSTSIGEPSAISISTTATDESVAGANDGSIVATAVGGTGAFTYVWDDGQTTGTASGLTGGEYVVTATDANGCMATATDTVDAGVSVFISELTNDFKVNIYPNPNSGQFNIELSTIGDYMMVIENVIGEKVLEQNVNNRDNLSRAISNVESGVYFVSIAGKGTIYTERIVIK